jgi:hypothetical protein
MRQAVTDAAGRAGVKSHTASGQHQRSAAQLSCQWLARPSLARTCACDRGCVRCRGPPPPLQKGLLGAAHHQPLIIGRASCPPSLCSHPLAALPPVAAGRPAARSLAGRPSRSGSVRTRSAPTTLSTRQTLSWSYSSSSTTPRSGEWAAASRPCTERTIGRGLRSSTKRWH